MFLLNKRTSFFLFLFLACILFAQDNNTPQRNVQLINANTIYKNTKKYGNSIQVLKGDVVVMHDKVLMKCDSAILDTQTNTFFAYKNVYVNSNDTINMYGDYLDYYGDQKWGKIYGKARMIDPSMELSSDTLYYDRKEKIAFFNYGGKIKTKDGETLESEVGVYDMVTKSYKFDENVIIEDEKHFISSEKAVHNNQTGKSIFKGKTFIREKQSANYIYTEDGYYDKQNEIAKGYKNNKIVMDNTIITGDSLMYYKNLELAIGKNNVEIIDNKEGQITRGHYAEYYKDQDSAMITDRPYVIRPIENDSLYIASDTIIAVRKIIEKDTVSVLHSFHNSRFYKSDLQGRADSLSFSQNTGELNMYRNPILWSADSQMTADTIKVLFLKNEQKIDSLKLIKNAMIIQKADSTGIAFNQISGQNMNGKFIENDLRRFWVLGNVQTVFYVDEEKDSITNTSSRVGINTLKCATMRIELQNKELDQMTCIKSPLGVLYPVKDVPPNVLKLPNFIWREEERLRSKNDVFIY